MSHGGFIALILPPLPSHFRSLRRFGESWTSGNRNAFTSISCHSSRLRLSDSAQPAKYEKVEAQIMRNKIGTKIIGGYILFVVLVLLFLGASYRLTTTAVSHAQDMYNHTEELRLEMEAENTFWKQVSAMTNYLLLGDEEYLTEYYELQRHFSKQIDAFKPFMEGKHPEEEETLRHLTNRYDIFIAKFNRVVVL